MTPKPENELVSLEPGVQMHPGIISLSVKAVSEFKFWYDCQITKVLDGDTVDIDWDLGAGIHMKKERIRLYGINAPEKNTDKGKFARAALIDFIVQSEQDNLPFNILKTRKQSSRTTTDKKGKYGRYLGEFYRADGLCLNTWMVDMGHAEIYLP